MNIDDMTYGELKKIASMFSGCNTKVAAHKFTGKYVIVRCRDAGVHAGILTDSNGRSCTLSESRRLWYWKPANKASFLSGVATEGLDEASKVGAPIDIHLTENCEIIQCTDKAAKSIQDQPNYEQ